MKAQVLEDHMQKGKQPSCLLACRFTNLCTQAMSSDGVHETGFLTGMKGWHFYTSDSSGCLKTVVFVSTRTYKKHSGELHLTAVAKRVLNECSSSVVWYD